ncbi:MAG TPA: DUF1269 domain-containing protein [Planctomycetota bacterium]|nr:DUF1269 domain-containing protein [Planctomycetota bacterium]
MPKEMNITIGVYPDHNKAEDAILTLKKSGFDMKKLSIIGKDYQSEEHAVGFYNMGERVQVWGKRGAFWGGLMGMLFGSAMFAIPGIGPLIVLGPLVGWIVGGLEGAAVVGGLSALGAALFSAGIPKDSIVQYETELKTGKYLVVAHGSEAEVAKAREILGHPLPAGMSA